MHVFVFFINGIYSFKCLPVRNQVNVFSTICSCLHPLVYVYLLVTIWLVNFEGLNFLYFSWVRWTAQKKELTNWECMCRWQSHVLAQICLPSKIKKWSHQYQILNSWNSLTLYFPHSTCQQRELVWTSLHGGPSSHGSGLVPTSDKTNQTFHLPQKHRLQCEYVCETGTNYYLL